MKKTLLSLVLALTAFASQAQFTRTYTGSIALTDPAIPGNRLSRDGVAGTCATTKTVPTTIASTGVHYDTYIVSNPSRTSSTCVTVSVSTACANASEQVFVVAHRDQFIPTNVQLNYKSDMGESASQTFGSKSFAMTLASNEKVVLVVQTTNSTEVCAAYAMTLSSPIALPVTKVRDLPALLSAYPNPTTDELHIEAAKPGTYTLYNTLGESVRRISTPTVSLAGLPAGMYLLQDDETKQTARVVKQ